MTSGARDAGLSAAIAEHVAATTFADLPPATVAAAKRAILDGLGVMLAASGLSSEVRPFVALARVHPGPAAILGTGERASASMAALANGAMAHALDYEDAFDLAPAHPDASLLPAAFAVAQAHGPVSGEALITAVAVGCDLVCRLALSLTRSMEEGGWYPPPILGAFGAVVAAAKLMRLEPRQVLDAVSLVLAQNSCPGQIKHERETVIRAVREAFPAQAATTAVELAAYGVRGFDQPFEGAGGFFRLFANGAYDPAVILDGLGERYWIEALSFKPWPCCRGTHAYVEAALDLMQRHGLEANAVREIVLTTGEVQQMLVQPEARKRAPATAIDAKFSIPFTVATALVHGRVDLESFSDAALADPRVLALAARTRNAPRADWGRDRAASGGLVLVIDDRRRFEAQVEAPLGDPARPLSDEALRAKFLDCARFAARPPGRDAAERLADAVLSLERQEDAGALLQV
jgi:2-methylcitrate dehydratase PrpD